MGALYNGEQWGVMVRPKVTLDILVGRSAILHPGLFFAWSSVDVIDASGQDTPDKRISFGFDIAYAAMFCAAAACSTVRTPKGTFEHL